MTPLVFFDSGAIQFYPLTLTRSITDLRCGILTLLEKWMKRFEEAASFHICDQEYLSPKYTCDLPSGDVLVINSRVFANDDLVNAAQALKQMQVLHNADGLIAACLPGDVVLGMKESGLPDGCEMINYSGEANRLNHIWELFTQNDRELKADFELLTKSRKSQKLHDSNHVFGDQIFVEEGAEALASTFNCTSSPIYLGKNSLVMEGSHVRGGLALCDHSTLKLGAKIYGATTIGPHSKVGGEVGNSVIIGYSNKGHDGYMGNSLLGEWCNLGADTNTSNLKNNYAEVRLWNYADGRFAKTGEQFCGLVMGDHSKCGINTMWNTGTVVGVSANVYGGGYPRNFIPSFSWGGAAKMIEYRFDKACEVADIVMKRRKKSLTEIEQSILQAVFDLSSEYRKS